MTLGRSLSEVLDECLQRVLADGESVEACVARYPEYAEELRDELETAMAFRGAFEFTPNVDKKRAARLRMNEAIVRRESKRFGFNFPWLRGLFPTGTRIAVAAAVGVLALVSTGTGTVFASYNTAPGDLLYGVKRTSEDVQLAFALSDTRESDLLDTFVERRVGELDVVTATGRERFVPDLVDDTIRKSERAQKLVSAPVRRLVGTLPDATDANKGTGDLGPDGLQDGTPVPTPDDEPVSGDKKVSAARVLALNEKLLKIEEHLAVIEKKVVQQRSRDEVKRLRQALNQTTQNLDSLMDRAGQVREDGPRQGTPQEDGDDPRATAVDPTPEMPDPALVARGAGRVPGVVKDVVLRQQDGKLVRVDVEVILENGDLVIVVIERGGPRLVKGGETVGIRQLRIGQRVALGVDSDGEVQVLSIVTPPQTDDRDSGAPHQ